MLAELINTAALVTAPILLLGFFRESWKWGLIVLFLSFSMALFLQTAQISDLWMLPFYNKTAVPIASIGLWLLFSITMGQANQARNLGSPSITAFALGLCIGEWGAAMSILQRCTNPTQRVKLICASIGGAMLSPCGDVGGLILDESLLSHLYLLPIAVLLMIYSFTGTCSLSQPENGTYRPYILGGLASIFCATVPEYSIVIMAIFCMLAFIQSAQFFNVQWKLLSCFLLGALALNFTIASGLPELLAWAVEDSQFMHGTYIRPLLFAGSAVISCLVGELYSGIFALSFLDRALDLQLQGCELLLAMGVSVGGVMPFVLGRCVKEAWRVILGLIVVSSLYVLVITTLFSWV